MTINSSKSKSIRFGRGRNYNELNYHLNNEKIPQVVSCKYLGVHLNNKLSWENQVNSVVGQAWKSLHFIRRILKRSSGKAKELAYLSLVRPIMEYGAICWDPYRISQNNSLERIQQRVLKFCFRGNTRNVSWESLEDRRLRARLCAMFKAYSSYPAWKAITRRLYNTTYLSRGDHKHKIKNRLQRCRQIFIHKPNYSGLEQVTSSSV